MGAAGPEQATAPSARATTLPLPEHGAPCLLPVASLKKTAPLYRGDVYSKLNRQGRLMLAPLLSPSLGSKLVSTVVSDSVMKYIPLQQPLDSWT